MKLTIYETVTNTIIEALRRGVVPWKKPWAEAAAPVNAMTQRAYRGVNVLLLSLSRYTDHRWLTLKQVNEKGGRVKTGERARMVVFWKQWQPSAEDDEQPKPRPKPVLRYFHVFNAEQCEELRLSELYRPPETTHQRIERAEVIVKSMPDPPRIREGTAAWYSPADDLVQVPPLRSFETADSYYSTLFHELGHATGHERRLNRPAVMGEVQFGSGVYSHEELVAELTSTFCCATASLDNSLLENSASYIDSWLKVLRGDPKMVVIAATQAQKACDYIKGITYNS
jgi:antirestriction protein ArdC